MELLERAAAAASPLLAAESIADGGLLLTFEAGRLRLAGDPASAELVVELVEAGDLDALRRVNLGEEEPWWRLVGSPLVTVHAISGGAAQSWQMVNRGQTMVRNEFDFGFALDWMRKDLRICFEEAGRNGASLPITAIVDQFYARLQRQGHGRWDTSTLIHLLRD